MLDLLISGGLIVDGTGNEGSYGAVGVVGESLHILRGEVSSTGQMVVDQGRHTGALPGRASRRGIAST